ncbi:MAG: hypothetical protein GY941_26820, partial [Planctomycetes bacterium]|nr:hypothetical protein [Planctomycetota bacterium]
MDFEEAKDLFVSKKNIIDQVIKKNCFKNNLSLDVADDFTSNVYEKLMEDSCRKIREFKGNSSFKTYISVIIFRIFEDKKRTWGRWKPSREALRFGPEAVKLEQLVFRDNNTGEQAYDALTADPEFSITRERAFEILEKLERKHLKRRKRHEIELSDEL